MLVENYSNSRSLQTLSAAEAIFSGLRANRTEIRGSIADPVDVLNSPQLLNLVYAFCRAGVVLYATQLSFHDV